MTCKEKKHGHNLIQMRQQISIMWPLFKYKYIRWGKKNLICGHTKLFHNFINNVICVYYYNLLHITMYTVFKKNIYYKNINLYM